MRLFEVGGCIRDELMGIPSKDIDFAVEVGSFDEMVQWLDDFGYEIFLSNPEFLTVRARFPRNHSIERYKGLTADFVMCRSDGESSDGRRPDEVFPGTIFDDLARRDFAMNAIARDIGTGEIIDPHHGVRSIHCKTLRFVGIPMERIREDGLRVLRGLRFMITRGVKPTVETWEAIRSSEAAELLGGVSQDRRREELVKMFSHDTMATMELLEHRISRELRDVIMDGLRLMPTTKERIN